MGTGPRTLRKSRRVASSASRPRDGSAVLVDECEQWGRPFGHSGLVPVEAGPRTAVLLWVEGDRDEMQIAAEDPGRGVSAQALRTRAGSIDPQVGGYPHVFRETHRVDSGCCVLHHYLRRDCSGIKRRSVSI